jgi:NOL1/NOP2/fmu family ribosome biogenesis protein
LSNEVIASRVDTLQLTLARTGYDNYVLANQPIERLAENLGDQFDCVLVDAPCSGQSLVGRDKQSLSAFSTRQIEHSAARQQTILKAAVQLVRPGGRLIYSTCTFSFTENEAVMAWLCEQLPDWVRVIEPGLAAWQSPVAAGCYRLWPHRDGCHGGFAAALDRPTNGDHVRSSNLLCDQSFSSTARNEKPLRGGKRLRTSVATNWHAVDPAKTDCTWGRYLTSEPLWQRGTVLNWFSPAVPTEWRALAHAGIEVAEAFGEHWHPSYPLATMQPSQTWFQPERYVEFCDREAIGFMSGLSLPHVGQPGWAVARWRARPLSWGKQVDAQFKNHLPKPLRQNSLTHF